MQLTFPTLLFAYIVYIHIPDELTFMSTCMFPDPVKRTLGMYVPLYQAILCTTFPAKRKRTAEIESIQNEQTMSELKHTTPSEKESHS